ncbi:MAG: Single-stranded-DNA-specific exonuclease RecJ [Opitutia bacterium UBA7350]|nr:MAG: Single-stranded-DNA-specific exonuclease RecJ [Opitutae bacterium UBA7350]
MNWKTTETDPIAVENLQDGLGLDSIIAKLLVGRGILTIEQAEQFLRPQLSSLEDPFKLTHLKAAVERIGQALDGNESVVVFGDYDVDGVTSTVQLVSLLSSLGLKPRYSVPLRLKEGYGMSREAIDRVLDGEVPDLFIALDCGTNAHEAVAYLRELGAEVIIVDHHQAKVGVPDDCLIVNPHVFDAAEAPWRNLCTAGLVFKLLHGIIKQRRLAEDDGVKSLHLRDYLDLVAMGTIADLVPLQDENRILAWYGLQHLRANRRPGVRALCAVASLSTSQPLESTDISFKLAPRINASGRLADASKPIELLLSHDEQTCGGIARELDAINCERQEIQHKIVSEAEAYVEAHFGDFPGIILYNEGWHPGVVGIVASRVSRRFHKPCVVLGCEGSVAKGSGRSVAGVDLVQLFQRCDDLLEHWGGHPMAAGISLPKEALGAFRKRFMEALADVCPEGLPEPVLELSAWLEVKDLNVDFLDALDRLQPFGQENRQPIFGLQGMVLESLPKAFAKGGSHYRFELPSVDGKQGLKGVAWQMESMPPVGKAVDLALRFDWNYWRNARNPQLTLLDWRFAK